MVIVYGESSSTARLPHPRLIQSSSDAWMATIPANPQLCPATGCCGRALGRELVLGREQAQAVARCHASPPVPKAREAFADPANASREG